MHLKRPVRNFEESYKYYRNPFITIKRIIDTPSGPLGIMQAFEENE